MNYEVSKKEYWTDYHTKGHLYPSFGWDNLAKLVDLSDVNNVFEIGCGSSGFLMECAKRGKFVGGIDYSIEGIHQLESALDYEGIDNYLFQNDSIFNYSCERLEVDMICSFGFLEHFTNSKDIIERAIKGLKPGGILVSTIPNLMGVNAKLFAEYDPAGWHQHVPYSLEQFRQMHDFEELEPIYGPRYFGQYDEFMLIPWQKIKAQKTSLKFKLMKYHYSFIVKPMYRGIQKLGIGNAELCPQIVGIYRRVR